MNQRPRKYCFFVTPIGQEKSESRDRCNALANYVIEQAIHPYGYELEIGHTIDENGSVMTQVFERLVEADLVISDLVSSNFNVGFETAIRVLVNKPIIYTVPVGQTPPFDLGDNRAIPINHNNRDSIALGIKAIQKQIEHIEANKERNYSSPAVTWINNNCSRQAFPSFLRNSKIWMALKGLTQSSKSIKPTSAVTSPINNLSTPMPPLPELLPLQQLTSTPSPHELIEHMRKNQKDKESGFASGNMFESPYKGLGGLGSNKKR